MQANQGILLVATGHPYFAQMAFNLAVSIRYHDRFANISLVHDGQGFNMLEGWQQDAFDTIELPKKINSDDPYSIKLHLDELTPYHKTLFLDVDMLWGNFKTPEQMFTELDGIDFTMVNRSVLTPEDAPLSRWVNMKEMAEAYKTDRFFDISSEVIYFEGKPEVFAEARKAYKKPKVSVSAFGAGLPDEAFFMMAMAKMGLEPHTTPWEPTYWEPRHFPKQHNRSYIDQFYAISAGGAFVSNHIKKIYDSLCKHYYNSMGIAATPYQLIPKSRILKERRKI